MNSDLNHKTILVCGGAGFIGSNFIYYIYRKYPRVKIVNLDKFTYASRGNNICGLSKTRYFEIKGDIASLKVLNQVFKKFNPDYLINFAAETHVDRSIHGNRTDFFDSNIKGVFNLLEMVKKFSGVKKYVQVSTDEVYGSLSLSGGSFTEQSRLKPNSLYAASKASGDILCLAYFKTWQLPVIVTRCSNNYGPYQHPEKLIPFFISLAVDGKELPLYGDGKNVRDWIYVEDHCRALTTCLLTGVSGEVYNIGAQEEKDNLSIAKIILDGLNQSGSQIKYVKDRPGHDRRYSIDATKLREQLKWVPIFRFKKQIKITIDWYVNNKAWLKKIKNNKINSHIV